SFFPLLFLPVTSVEIPQEFLDACKNVAYWENAPSPIPANFWVDPFAPDPTYTTAPYSVSKPESIFYYSGLPSGPVLVYRTGTKPWKRPTGPEAYRELKDVLPVFGHEILTVWDDLGPKICECLDSVQITWTSVDVVRFAVVGEVPGPPVLWIGVMPNKVSAEDAHTAAVGCLKLLDSYNLTDIEVEFRESVFVRYAGPKLLKSVSSFNATAGVHAPLTPALGLQIAARATPYAEGTGGLYISDGDKVYVLSARHVLLPPNEGDNELYDRTNGRGPRREVLLAGPEAFQTLLRSIMVKIARHHTMVDLHKRQLDGLTEMDAEYRTKIEGELKKAAAAMITLNQFHDEVTKYWSEENQRVLGHIAYSPPITVGTGAEAYTEDWGLVELNRDKIDWDNFKGNVIDLGMDIRVPDFVRRIDPVHGHRSFQYPCDRLLPLRGVIEEDEMRCPKMRDADEEPRLIVTKSGYATGVTIGCATGANSFVREYFPDGRHQTSMEWPILPYDHKAGVFSTKGDSGAVIVDSQGRIGGLLTGGTGKNERTDVTYATPFSWLLQRIKTHLPNADLYQPTALDVVTSTQDTGDAGLPDMFLNSSDS
ncbi:hypothetical protein M408DRAFT_155554, partial [Serendipita vermifera MAFF 305830]